MRRFEDPLAELARLIGQDDPFADFVAHKPGNDKRRVSPSNGSGNRNSPEPRYDERDASAHERDDAHERDYDDPRYEDSNGNGHAQHDSQDFDARELSALAGQNGRANGRQPSRQQAQQRAHEQYDDHYEDEYEQPQPKQVKGRFSRAPQHDEYDYPEEPRQQARRRDESNGHFDRNGSGYPQGDRHDPYYDDQYQDEYEQPSRQPKQAPANGRAEARQARQEAKQARQQARQAKKGRGNTEFDEYADHAQLPAHMDDYYEDAPKKGGANWFLIGGAAACILILGVTGVFGYRAVFGTGTPKTIKAENTTNKVAAVPASEPGKNNDRVGFDAPPSGERIVSRQEEPVNRAPAPGSSPFAPPPQSGQQAPQRPQAQAQTPTSEGEPKRVRTYSVRADGSVVGEPRSNTTGSTSRQGQVSNSPMSINSYAERDGGSAPAQQAMPSQRSQAQSGPAPASGNPWADVPNSPQRATPAPQQQASINNSPPPVPRAPTSSIAVQSPLPAGSYVVQVASQKTEQEAQSAWQQTQQRYSSVLGGQQAQIRKVNLGDRGTFYRAQLGPYNDRARATEICENLKAAGGECIIQRN